MNCKEVQDRLIAYLDDELSTEEAARVQHHLAGCEACQQEMAALWKLQSRVSQTFQQQAAGVAPLPDAWTRLQVQIRQKTNAPGRLRWFGGWNMRQRRLVFSGIATLMVVGISLILAATPAWAAIAEWFGGLFRVDIPNTDGEMVISSEFAPLFPTYVPESFYASGTLSGGEPGSKYTELRYFDNHHFIILYEIQSQGDEALPNGQPTTVSGNPAVLQTGLAGTAILAGGAQEGRPAGSGGGGGGGGSGCSGDDCNGPTPEPMLFPGSIDYVDGRQLVWFVDGLYIELLTNLSEDELVKVAESLVLAEEVPPEEAPEFVPPPEPGEAPPESWVDPDPALDFTPLAPSILPTDLEILKELTINDAQGQKIMEARYIGFDRFVIIELSHDQGESLGDGESVTVGGYPAVMATGLSGTALFDTETLQDGTASAGPAITGVGGSVPDITIYPTELAYQDGIQLIWVQDGLHLKLLTNLSQEEAFSVAGSLVPFENRQYPPWVQTWNENQ